MKSKHMYYDSLQAMKIRYARQTRSCAFQAGSLLEYDQWKNKTRTKLRKLLGLKLLKTCDLQPQLLEEEFPEGENFSREKWLIQTEEGVYMPFYLLKPKWITEGKSPVIIACHGHGSGGKVATAGVWKLPKVKDVVTRQNYTYGVEMVRRGFYVFCPDARGFGERRERSKQGDSPEKYMSCSCRELSHMTVGLGITVAGLWVWDLMRLIDYIDTRPDCRKDRIGCIGLSGGGMQALWLSALDDRISMAAVSGYFYGFQDALLEMNQNCSCNYIPSLWETVDMGDIGALIAPRPFIIESGIQDHLNGRRGIKNVVEQVEIVKRAYRLFRAEKALIHDIFDGAHQWHGEKVYQAAEYYLKQL